MWTQITGVCNELANLKGLVETVEKTVNIHLSRLFCLIKPGSKSKGKGTLFLAGLSGLGLECLHPVSLHSTRHWCQISKVMHNAITDMDETYHYQLLMCNTQGLLRQHVSNRYANTRTRNAIFLIPAHAPFQHHLGSKAPPHRNKSFTCPQPHPLIQIIFSWNAFFKPLKTLLTRDAGPWLRR